MGEVRAVALLVLCCASLTAAAQGESAPDVYALNCRGCHHAFPNATSDLHVAGEYTAQFRQEPDKRRFFIRVPSSRDEPLSPEQNHELLAEILSWAKACPQLPPGTPLNVPGAKAAVVVK